MEPAQAQWPEDVLSKTWEIATLAKQLADLSKFFCSLPRSTLAQLKGTYGEEWKKRFPSFRIGSTKAELIENVKKCYQTHMTTVLSGLKPKQKLFDLFEALKANPETSGKAASVMLKKVDTTNTIVDKLVTMIMAPETSVLSSSASSSSTSSTSTTATSSISSSAAPISASTEETGSANNKEPNGTKQTGTKRKHAEGSEEKVGKKEVNKKEKPKKERQGKKSKREAKQYAEELSTLVQTLQTGHLEPWKKEGTSIQPEKVKELLEQFIAKH
ncbi:hypothetical protein QOT17_007363 [Balamuthia mandrillaris]